MECFSAPEYMVNTHNFSHVGSWYVVLEVPFHFLSKIIIIILQQRAAALIDTLWHEGLMDELTASSEASWRRGRHTLFEVWKRWREGDSGRAAGRAGGRGAHLMAGTFGSADAFKQLNRVPAGPAIELNTNPNVFFFFELNANCFISSSRQVPAQYRRFLIFQVLY